MSRDSDEIISVGLFRRIKYTFSQKPASLSAYSFSSLEKINETKRKMLRYTTFSTDDNHYRLIVQYFEDDTGIVYMTKGFDESGVIISDSENYLTEYIYPVLKGGDTEINILGHVQYETILSEIFEGVTEEEIEGYRFEILEIFDELFRLGVLTLEK